MNEGDHLLTAQEYHKLYCRAFARLEDIAQQAEQAMLELEELQLSMGDQPRPTPSIVPLPTPSQHPDTP